MTRTFLLAATTLVVSTLAGAASLNGCGMVVEDCECPAVPDRPERASFPLRELRPIPAPPPETRSMVSRSGTLTVSEDRVVVRYSNHGIEHEIVYTVGGPL